MAHELVHAWGLPTPRNFAHGWTTFTDDYIALRLGLFPPAEVESKWQFELNKVRENDPGLDRLDVTARAKDSREQRLLDKKVGMILKELHGRYGMETFARFVRACRQEGAMTRQENPDEPTISLDDFVFHFSRVVGEDLGPLFRTYGATVHARSAI
jgi:hypothetical protein